MRNLPMFWPDDLEKASREKLIFLLVEYQKIALHQQTCIESVESDIVELKQLVDFLWREQL